MRPAAQSRTTISTSLAVRRSGQVAQINHARRMERRRNQKWVLHAAWPHCQLFVCDIPCRLLARVLHSIVLQLWPMKFWKVTRRPAVEYWKPAVQSTTVSTQLFMHVTLLCVVSICWGTVRSLGATATACSLEWFYGISLATAVYLVFTSVPVYSVHGCDVIGIDCRWQRNSWRAVVSSKGLHCCFVPRSLPCLAWACFTQACLALIVLTVQCVFSQGAGCVWLY